MQAPAADGPGSAQTQHSSDNGAAPAAQAQPLPAVPEELLADTASNATQAVATRIEPSMRSSSSARIAAKVADDARPGTAPAPSTLHTSTMKRYATRAKERSKASGVERRVQAGEGDLTEYLQAIRCAALHALVSPCRACGW